MTTLHHLRPERWPRLSLKGFFVLVTIVGAGLGWLGVQVKWIHERHEVFRMGGADYYTGDFGKVAAPLSIGILGERGYSVIDIETEPVPKPPRLRKYSVKELRNLFPEARMSFSNRRGDTWDATDDATY